MPRRSIYTTSVYAEFMADVSKAVHAILAMLYQDTPPQIPISNKSVVKIERNEEIRTRHEQGETIAQLAKSYNLSEQRIHQILNHRRK
jgi:hypothetical protein